MRTEIERWLLIALLCFGYLSQVPGVIHQGTIGLPALVLGLLITLLVLLLKRSSAGTALFIAALAAFALVLRLIGHFVIEPHLAHGAPLSDFRVAVSAAGSMLIALLATDLWSTWKKKANKSPEANALPGQ
jgi:hypothetical protein